MPKLSEVSNPWTSGTSLATVDPSLRPANEQLQRVHNALVALTNKRKNRLNTHMKELYVKHTMDWNGAQQECLDEDIAIN